jgi:hypothetical protein
MAPMSALATLAAFAAFAALAAFTFVVIADRVADLSIGHG